MTSLPLRPAAAPRSSAWIPWVFVGAFAVIIAVNAVMVWHAVSSFSGVAVQGPFDRGRNYDAVIAEAERQRALGWTMAVALEGGRLTVRAAGPDGRPLDRLEITAVLTRPAEALPPVPVALVAEGGGRYSGVVRAPKPGLWDARLTLVGRGPGERVETVERVVADAAAVAR
jgi:nitrogen fixation protein FixH